MRIGKIYVSTTMEVLKEEIPAVQMNDTLMQWIGIPFFGIVIPNAAGLFGNLSYADSRYWAGYLVFIVLSALIWKGNRHLLFLTRKRFTWFDKPIEKLILLLVNNFFYTSPLTIACICLWYRFAGFNRIHWDVVEIVVLVNVICVLFITHVYETVFMLKEQQSEQLRIAVLLRAKAEAELEALKNQIDPHFMFNSLNSLSYLISADQKKASLFTENLAEVYRYILSQKDRTLVLLQEELDFTHKYTELLHLRFGEAIQFNRKFNPHLDKKFLIPPTSVFVALENAVKHNELSEQFPLNVDIGLESDALTISNKIRAKRNLQHSSGIGLKNLDERFRIITGKKINVNKSDNTFQVELPLLPLNKHS